MVRGQRKPHMTHRSAIGSHWLNAIDRDRVLRVGHANVSTSRAQLAANREKHPCLLDADVEEAIIPLAWKERVPPERAACPIPRALWKRN
jgi:hypothetical protein